MFVHLGRFLGAIEIVLDFRIYAILFYLGKTPATMSTNFTY